MNMLDEIYTTLVDNATLFGFTYHGRPGNVDPCYTPETGNIFLLWFDGEEMTVGSMEEVLQTPFFDGRTLVEIAGEITVTDW